MTEQKWNYVKWFANFAFIIATISMLSPVVAATAVFPWLVYLLANGVWMADSVQRKDWAWFSLALFFCVWDALLILTRTVGVDAFVVLQPVVKILERLP